MPLRNPPSNVEFYVDGVRVAARAKVNFSGAGVVDDAVNGWVGITIVGGGATELDGLDDVAVASASAGQSLMYRADALGEGQPGWTNDAIAQGDVVDLTGDLAAINTSLGTHTHTQIVNGDAGVQADPDASGNVVLNRSGTGTVLVPAGGVSVTGDSLVTGGLTVTGDIVGGTVSGNGAGLTGVDAATLDGVDGSAYALDASLTSHAAATSAHGAASANTASRIVARDAGGKFAATEITAGTGADVVLGDTVYGGGLYATGYYNTVLLTPNNGSGSGLCRAYWGWQVQSGYSNNRVLLQTGFDVGDESLCGLYVTNSTTTSPALKMRGIASQAGDFATAVDAAGAERFSVDKDGKISAGSKAFGTPPVLDLNANNGAAQVDFVFPTATYRIVETSTVGTNDLYFQGLVGASGYFIIDCYTGLGLRLKNLVDINGGYISASNGALTYANNQVQTYSGTAALHHGRIVMNNSDVWKFYTDFYGYPIEFDASEIRLNPTSKNKIVCAGDVEFKNSAGTVVTSVQSGVPVLGDDFGAGAETKDVARIGFGGANQIGIIMAPEGQCGFGIENGPAGANDYGSDFVVYGNNTGAAASVGQLVAQEVFRARHDGTLWTQGTQGASGSFTASGGETVTVTNGLITGIVAP